MVETDFGNKALDLERWTSGEWNNSLSVKTTGVVGDDVNNIIENNDELKDVKLFLSEHDINSDTKRNSLKASIKEMADFYDQLTPFISKMKNLNSLLNHLNFLLEKEKQDKIRKENANRPTSLIDSIKKMPKNTTNILIQKVRGLKWWENTVWTAVNLLNKINQSLTEKIWKESLLNMFEQYIEIKDSFEPLYILFGESYESLLEEKKKLEENLKLTEQHLNNNNNLDNIEKLKLLKEQYEEDLENLEWFLLTMEYNWKSYTEISKFLADVFPKSLLNIRIALPTLELTKISEQIEECANGVIWLDNKITEKVFLDTYRTRENILNIKNNLIKSKENKKVMLQSFENKLNDDGIKKIEV